MDGFYLSVTLYWIIFNLAKFPLNNFYLTFILAELSTEWILTYVAELSTK